MNEIIVLIDNGHGDPPLTGGKCSPDHRLREYTYCRDIARRIDAALSLRGVKTVRIVPEKEDVPLPERVRRVNSFCRKHGAKNVVLVSVHNNAAGDDGKWHDARGFCVFVAQNASASSKKLARIFTECAEKRSLMGNRWVPDEKYWVKSLAMCRDTKCPAVLTENLFQDNEEDVAFLLSDAGREAIVALHVEAILEYINNQ